MASVMLSVLSLGLVFAVGGCGGNSELASVTGKITLDGKPLAEAFVVFAPTAAGTTSYGRTNAAGEYVMMFSDSEKGAWQGENIVRISTGDVGAGAKKEILPAIYNVESTLRKSVEKKANRFDFELKSNAGKIKQSIMAE
jgi:hypothetical protein